MSTKYRIRTKTKVVASALSTSPTQSHKTAAPALRMAGEAERVDFPEDERKTVVALFADTKDSAPHFGQEFPSRAPQSPQIFFPKGCQRRTLRIGVGCVS